MELDELRGALADAVPAGGDLGRAREAVAGRARRIRTRRRVASGGALLAVMAIVLVGIVAMARNGDTSSVVAGGPTIPASGAGAPLIGIPEQVAFVDATHGYGLVTKCSGAIGATCRITIGASTDGGASWTVAGTITAQYPQWSGEPFINLAASGEHVWVYGNRTFFSRDGARTWVEQHPGGIVNSLVPQGNDAWAVVRDCAPSESCATKVASVPVGGGAYHDLAPVSADSYPYSVLQRPTASVGYLYATDNSSLFRTLDGGRSWQRVSTPGGQGPAGIAAAGTDQVWIVRGDPSATTALDKTVYRFIDSGDHWKTVARNVGGAPTAGYPERGYVGDVVWTAPDRLYVVSYPTIVSTDGGGSWSAIGPLGVTGLSFADANHGWATVGSGIYRTVDGTHWQLVYGHPAVRHVVVTPTSTSKAATQPPATTATTTATTAASNTTVPTVGTQPPTTAYGLTVGRDGFLVPNGWTGGPAVGGGGPAKFSTYRPPNGGLGSIQFEESGGEFPMIYNTDHSPNVVHALTGAGCTVTSHVVVNPWRATFTCAPAKGVTSAGVMLIYPFPGGWKRAIVNLPAGSDQAETNAILASVT
jgi:hypothetical protein